MRIICKSGLSGDRHLLQSSYSSFAEFEAWDETYGISARLGYKTAKGCWRANPMIESSVDPADLRKAKETTFEEYAAYAATWGGEACYDTPPNEKGDGELFYQFGINGKNPEFIVKFIPAIERTMKQDTLCPEDLVDLGLLMEFAKRFMVR